MFKILVLIVVEKNI